MILSLIIHLLVFNLTFSALGKCNSSTNWLRFRAIYLLPKIVIPHVPNMKRPCTKLV